MSGRVASNLQGWAGVSIFPALILFTLPFMQAFTLPVGFPLKIYELVIVWWMVLSAITMRLIVFDRALFFRGMAFIAYALLALVINLNLLGNVGAYASLARMGPFMDGFMKCGYILLCLFGFCIVADATRKNSVSVRALWIKGAIVSACIHFAMVMATALGFAVPILPGMLPEPTGQQFFNVGSVLVFRAGTFLEGNYAGPFFVLSFLIAWSMRRYKTGFFFLAAAFTTFSTSAMVGLAAAFAYVSLSKRSFVYPVLIFLMAIVLLSTPYFEKVVIQKLFDTDVNSSVMDRQKTIMLFGDIFLQNPLIGVGAAQSGLHVAGGQSWALQNQAGMTVATLQGQMFKLIANNVYVELAAEFGLIGLALFFFVFLLPIVLRIWRGQEVYVRAGVIAILVFWLASPTFTMMYYWAFMGIACGVAGCPKRGVSQR